jgi:ubiquinol-cytochrome c reductase iron-sulfur subunit
VRARTTLKQLLGALLWLLVGRRRRPAPDDPDDGGRVVAAGEPEPRSELVVGGLLLLAGACALAFVVLYALDLRDQTQWLGLSLGLSLLGVAAALILAGKRLVVSEELDAPYPPDEHPQDQEAIVQTIEESGSRITRHRLLALCVGISGASLAAALVTPFASLGPVFDLESFTRTPWRRGRRLVDENGRPYRATDIEQDDMYTAFAEGSDKEAMGSSVVLVRLSRDQLDLPQGNDGYAADGIVAYSKICTHAGCAITLYRTPLFAPDEPRPALVCPCHYSAFDPGSGGTVLSGPAGRGLPMLPISIDRRGWLRATGTFDGPVGPSWLGVRRRKATT